MSGPVRLDRLNDFRSYLMSGISTESLDNQAQSRCLYGETTSSVPTPTSPQSRRWCLENAVAVCTGPWYTCMLRLSARVRDTVGDVEDFLTSRWLLLY